MRSKLYIFLVLLVIGCTNSENSRIDLERLKVVEELLKDDINNNKIPGAVVLVGNEKGIVYQKAFGVKNPLTNEKYAIDDIFRIASMTKALTSSAFLILAERENLALDTPVESILDEFKDLKVAKLENDEIHYESPNSKITFHQLLTHTSGFGYDFHHQTLSHLLLKGEIADLLDKEGKFLNAPLIEQPGTYWHYGIGIGWLGKVIEKLSGQSLNDFMTENVFEPLEMHETSFDISKLGEDRLPNIYAKDEDDGLTDISAFMASPQIEDFAYGGGGIFSCPEDYAKFLRMFLNKGKVNGKEFLSEKIITEMTSNQIGDLSVPFQPSFNPAIIAPNEWFPGIEKKWGYGFMINTEEVPNQRSKGSCAWSGIMNTFFWFDYEKNIGGTIMMQIAPCYHAKPKMVLQRFEEAVYRSL